MLRFLGWQLVTKLSGQLIGPVVAVKQSYLDTLSRNFDNQLPTYAA